MFNLLLHACAIGAATLSLPQDPYTELFGATLHFGDFDRDGAEDIYVTDPVAGDRLLHNAGGGLYEDVTGAHGLESGAQSLFALWFDFDADGALDLCVGGIDGSLRLLQNADRGHFVDVTPTTGLQVDAVGLDAEARDLDGDGRVDLHISSEVGGVLFRNAGAGRFERLSLPDPELAVLMGENVTGDADPEGRSDLGTDSGRGNAKSDADRSASRAAAARARRSALVASLGSSAATGPASAGGASIVSGGGTTTSLLAACMVSIDDQATANCFRANSVPTLGMLYPLSTELFVATNGRVGIGTTAPQNRLHVVNGNSGVTTILNNAIAIFENNGPAYLNVRTPDNAERSVTFSGPTSANSGALVHNPAVAPNGFELRTNGGTPRLTVTAAGNVGIGTSTPGNPLQVFGAVTTVASILGNQSGGTWFDVGNTSLLGRSWALISAGSGNGEGAGAFAIHDHTAATSRLVIDTNGDVGIGTVTPDYRLHVVASAQQPVHVVGSNAGGTWIDITNTTTGGDTWNLISTGSGNSEGPGKLLLRDGDTNTVGMTLQPNGNVGIGTTVPSERLSVAGSVQVLGSVQLDANDANSGTTANTLKFGGGGTGEAIGSRRAAGMNQYGLDFYTLATPRMSITIDGNVGIGTMAPADRLAVIGDTRVTGTTRINGNVHVDFNNTNTGTVTTGALLFGNQSTGEGIGCRKNTGVNDNQLDFYTGFTSRLTIDNSGRVGIGRQPGTFALEVQGDACKTGGTGFWNICSDARIKTDVRTIGGALATLDRLRLVEYRYTDEYLASAPSTVDKRYYNVIAQEYADVFPEYVSASEADGILKVDTYPALIHAIAAVQELHAVVQAQGTALTSALAAAAHKDAEIATLEDRLTRLEASFARFAPAQRAEDGH